MNTESSKFATKKRNYLLTLLKENFYVSIPLIVIFTLASSYVMDCIARILKIDGLFDISNGNKLVIIYKMTSEGFLFLLILISVLALICLIITLFYILIHNAIQYAKCIYRYCYLPLSVDEIKSGITKGIFSTPEEYLTYIQNELRWEKAFDGDSYFFLDNLEVKQILYNMYMTFGTDVLHCNLYTFLQNFCDIPTQNKKVYLFPTKNGYEIKESSKDSPYMWLSYSEVNTPK